MGIWLAFAGLGLNGLSGNALSPAEIESAFPSLVGSGWVPTSLPDPAYNCIAWAAGEQTRFWWPTRGGYWPPGAPRDRTLGAFVAAYRTKGYELCANWTFDPTQEKIAIFTKGGAPTHAARQLDDGKWWTSKLGVHDDISHDQDGLNGDQYGAPAVFMSRPRPGGPIPSPTA